MAYWSHSDSSIVGQLFPGTLDVLGTPNPLELECSTASFNSKSDVGTLKPTHPEAL